MKKIALILSLVLLPTLVFATSGACSGHSGVNCSAGSDSDGSVICNDGWRNSSVSYLSMVMCQGYSDKPTYTTRSIVVPKPTSTVPTTKVIKPIQQKEPTKQIETKKAEATPKAEITPLSPKTSEEIPAPKKKGFWASFFSFIF